MSADAATDHAGTRHAQLLHIPLCAYDDRAGRHRLSAVIDELTLTYDVVTRDPDGRCQVLSRHFATLRAARAWALAHGAAMTRVSDESGTGLSGREVRCGR